MRIEACCNAPDAVTESNSAFTPTSPSSIATVNDQRRAGHERRSVAKHEQRCATVLLRSRQTLHHVLALSQLFQMRLIFEVLLDHLGNELA